MGSAQPLSGEEMWHRQDEGSSVCSSAFTRAVSRVVLLFASLCCGWEQLRLGRAGDLSSPPFHTLQRFAVLAERHAEGVLLIGFQFLYSQW